MVYPSYLSGESVLAQRGFLAESVYGLTYITTKKTRRMVTDRGVFVYQKIKTSLFFGFETAKAEEYDYKVANLAKALFDFFYLATQKMDKREMEVFLTDSRFNWEILSKKDRGVFGQIVVRAKVKKMEKMYGFLKTKGIL